MNQAGGGCAVILAFARSHPLRRSILLALLLAPVAVQLAASDAPSVPRVEGGPVSFGDRFNGGGARDAPWSARIADPAEAGERLILTGTVFGRDNQPREGVTVYAYQTDRNGLYRHTPWSPPRLRGWTRTDAHGRYEFHTIKPAPYPWGGTRAHIHMTVAVPGKHEWWIPALSFAGDPLLSARVISQESGKGRFASIQPLQPQRDGVLRCVRDIRLPDDW